MAAGTKREPQWTSQVAAEVRDLAREHGGRGRAMARLAALMDFKNESAALRAAEAVLDQGYGRPMQAMELTGKDGNPLKPQEEPRRLDLSKLTNKVFEAVVRGREIMKRLLAEADAVDRSPGPSKAP